ncbi:MAG TPA: hypothetical protein DCR24_14615 [Bacillus bacterium]|nr:hypothetical protein [Bacillus sp. (in: firmicutes)]
MYWKLFRLLFGLLCGYLVVNWIPSINPFRSEEFLGEFILNPIEFLAGAMALVIGMFAKGGLIRDGILAVFQTLQGKKGFVSDIILAIGSLGCFFLLLPFGFWQTAVFFGFCCLYGIIAVAPISAEN